MKYITPTWDELYQMCITLAERIRVTGEPFNSIVAVSRGGLTPARILSDLLEMKDIHTLRCEYYSDIKVTKPRPKIIEPLGSPVRGHNILIVDDVADSGDSLALVKNYVLSEGASKVKIAVLYVKPWNRMNIDFYADQTDAWVIFPWERLEVLKSLLKKGVRKPDLIETGFTKEMLERLEGLVDSTFETGRN